MEAKLLKDPDNKCDYILVSADEQSLSYLNSGSPIRMALFTDNNDNLPWYKRKSIVVVIGKDLDFEHHKVHREGFFKKGLVDKSYLIECFKKLKRKIALEFLHEIDAIEIPDVPTSAQLLVEHAQEAPKQIEEFGETINTAQAAEILNVSYMSVSNLAKKGLIKGENSGFGWALSKAHIENLLKERPEWLLKIWKHARSCAWVNHNNGEITRDNETFIHIDRATKIINLSVNTMVKYAKAGLIRHIKEPGRDYYISVSHMGELGANPPAWLKKSWSYFAAQNNEPPEEALKAPKKPQGITPKKVTESL